MTRILLDCGTLGPLTWRVFLDYDVRGMCWDVFTEAKDGCLAAGSTIVHLDRTSGRLAVRQETEVARRCAIAVARVLSVAEVRP